MEYQKIRIGSKRKIISTWKTAAAKSLQQCPTLCYPIDGSPPSSAIPGILQARTLEWLAIAFSVRSLRRKQKQHEKDQSLNCQNWIRLLSKSVLSPLAQALFWASLVVQTIKHLPAMQETQVPSLGWDDPLEMEKKMATHYSTLTWKIPWMEEPGRLHSPCDHKEQDMAEQLHFHFWLF